MRDTAFQFTLLCSKYLEVFLNYIFIKSLKIQVILSLYYMKIPTNKCECNTLRKSHKTKISQGIMVYAFYSSTQEEEARRSL